MSATKQESHWQIQEAKQRFSELIRSVQADGPQFVTKHGEEIAVVIDIEEYRRLHPEPGQHKSFKDWLLSGPKADDEFVDRLGRRPKHYDAGEDLDIFAGPDFE
ncbi:MAG: type II toxin-antitoxin system Phd/YefM family antitoxin [Actinocrinis sp.]